MANNRMYIVCKEDNKYFAISKYYPSSGWYTQNDLLHDDLNEYFDEHKHNSEQDMWGETYHLVYETQHEVIEINTENKTLKIIK